MQEKDYHPAFLGKKTQKSYGRKRSRKLSETKKQTLINSKYKILIPENIIAPQNLFEGYFEHIVLEIGFGTADHLIKKAQTNPNIGFIGCEPFENGVAAALRQIEINNLKNLRIFEGDARNLLEKFYPSSFLKIYVLFPDPWPKKRHKNRRLLSSNFINFLLNLLKTCGSLDIASDSENYIEEILINTNIKEDIQKFSVRPNCFIGTKYEKKALSLQKKCYYLKFHKINNFQKLTG